MGETQHGVVGGPSPRLRCLEPKVGVAAACPLNGTSRDPSLLSTARNRWTEWWGAQYDVPWSNRQSRLKDESREELMTPSFAEESPLSQETASSGVNSVGHVIMWPIEWNQPLFSSLSNVLSRSGVH